MSDHRGIRIVLWCMLLVLPAVAPASDDDLIGVPVYPGARLDQAVTDHLEEVQAEEGAAYCTDDGPAKVAEFYRSEGFVPAGEGSRGRVVFRRDDVEVTIQGPPRKDPATGRKENDTLIVITREED